MISSATKFEQIGTIRFTLKDSALIIGLERCDFTDFGGFTDEKERMSEHALIEKIQRLSADRVEEVEDFVDFLLERDAGLTQSTMRMAEPAFERVWDNPEDAVYDEL